MVRFRPNVAALILNHAGELLVCERATIPGAWQFPQGGVDPDESPADALAREVREEVGLPPTAYQILATRGGFRYLYPEEVRRRKLRKHGFHGQEQTYFLCQLLPDAPPINVDQKPREFSNYQWILPANFNLLWVPEFKRDVYRQVMHEFFNLAV